MSPSNTGETNAGKPYRLKVERYWDGSAASSNQEVAIAVWLTDGVVSVNVDAPFYDDPPPYGPAGEKDGLWNYEVVELFLLGRNGRYLEIELGPHGHYLILALHRIRQVSNRLTPLRCSAQINANRWQCLLELTPDASLLPFTHTNGYAIHGQGQNRRYLAASPVPGKHPDFHQPSRFIPLKDLR